MVIPFGAGSAGDVALRIITAKMSTLLGKQIVIENVTGAAGIIGAERVARAAPDGYTIIGMGDSVVTTVPLLNKNVKYDPFKDFEPVCQVVTFEWVLVANPSFPTKTVKELIALAKAKPGTIDFSSGGNGSPQHLAMALFETKTGIKLAHVPYRSATAALTDVVAGTVPVAFTAIAVAEPFIKSGKLRVLGTGGPKRAVLLPDVPTVAEEGVPGFEWSTWNSIQLPAKTPQAIVDKLQKTVIAALNDDEVKAKLAAVGVVPSGGTTAELKAKVAHTYAEIAEIIKTTGITMGEK
jgi:tripartite-type tricarboxylate transporter receptor subunit TctC